jgi:hypothetical protein
MVIEAPFLITKMRMVCLGDSAVVQFEPNSYHEGQVSFISYRGINVSTNWGDRFVKWCNVVKIIKH